MLVLAITADNATTFLGLFATQALSWATVAGLGVAATGAAGALASQGSIHLWAVLVVGTAGAEAGSLVGWGIGHRIARAGLDPTGQHLSPRRQKALDAGARLEQKWGRLIAFFVPSWVSGALGMPFRQFAAWTLLSAALWTAGAALPSYGVASAASGKPTTHILVPLVIGVAALGVIWLITRTLRRRLRGKSATGPVDGAVRDGQ